MSYGELDYTPAPESNTPKWLVALFAILGTIVMLAFFMTIGFSVTTGATLDNERIKSCVDAGGSWDGGQEDCTIPTK